MRIDLTPENLLAAYCTGIFPMADDAGQVHWLAPDPRGIIELDRFSVPRTLRSVIRRGAFDVTVDRAFDEVVHACADRREGTWISSEIKKAYGALHRLGFAHSVEAWRDGSLAGGLYGVSVGGAFFGESMFHRVRDASKVALVFLVERLRQRRFTVLDVQFVTEHLSRFGAVDIRRSDYQRRLKRALQLPCTFADPPAGPAASI